MFGQGAQWGKITLWDAAADGDLEQCKLRMKSATTHVNGKDAQGKTALHEASRCKYNQLYFKPSLPSFNQIRQVTNFVLLKGVMYL